MLEFFVGKIGFILIGGPYVSEQDKRWVLVRPPGGPGTDILLARPSSREQETFIGDQTGGRVTFFLGADDFWRDYDRMCSLGIRFPRQPSEKPYGTVAVFEDLHGNRWDLIERASAP